MQAASTILRLQTIVSREVDPSDFAVVTVSAIHAGDKENIIPQEADLTLNVRAGIPETRDRVLDSITRIVNAEAAASGSPFKPTLTISQHTHSSTTTQLLHPSSKELLLRILGRSITPVSHVFLPLRILAS